MKKVIIVILIIMIPAILIGENKTNGIFVSPEVQQYIQDDTLHYCEYRHPHRVRLLYISSENMIVSLFQDREIEGSFSTGFFIGSGHIGETEYYYIMKEVSEGVYTRGQVETLSTHIVESDLISPRVVRLKYKRLNRKGKYEFMGNEYTRYLIIVPHETIIRQFSIK